MSDSDNSVDGSLDSIALAVFEKFKSAVPQYYSVTSGYRAGWHDRGNGKERLEYPFDMTEDQRASLPVHYAVWYDEYDRGYDAAADAIHEAQDSLITSARATYVPSYL